MLSIQKSVKVFRLGQLTVKIFPTIQEMGNTAAQEVANKICELLGYKPEINMIFAAAPFTR
jgi:glucosamine-6-phosphate deaminase